MRIRDAKPESAWGGVAARVVYPQAAPSPRDRVIVFPVHRTSAGDRGVAPVTIGAEVLAAS